MATFVGTSNADTANAQTGTLEGFTGGSLSELQDGAGDTFYGLAGADNIIAGTGNDTISGGGGNDTLNAGDGNDHLDAGQGSPASSERCRRGPFWTIVRPGLLTAGAKGSPGETW